MKIEEELVPRVEIIENPRDLLEHLKSSGCSIRLFLKEGDKERYGTTFPLDKDRMLRVYAGIEHDTLSSNGRMMIPKSRKEKGFSSTFVNIAPAYENQVLTFFLALRDLVGTEIKKNVPVFSFGFEQFSGNLTLGGIIYNFCTSRSHLDDKYKKEFDEKGKEFNLNEFGWSYPHG